MKNKSLIITIIIAIILVAAGGIFAASNLIDKTNVKNNSQKQNDKNCINGGNFGLVFETNGGEAIEMMSVCIACGPDSYNELPTPTQEGKKFIGWYYNKDLTKKVEGTSTLDVNPNPIKDGDCITGYNEVKLYAAWK